MMMKINGIRLTYLNLLLDGAIEEKMRNRLKRKIKRIEIKLNK